MSDHKPECALSDPCSADEPRHGYCGNSDFNWCMHCEEECDCARINRAEQRVRDEERGWEGAVVIARAGYEDGYRAALDGAREAVAALDIGRDVRFSVDVKADALAAIDALKEKP
jgi:hypothetical protein